MQNHERTFAITIALTCLILASCASTHAPHRWLPDPQHAATDIYGGWVDVKVREGEIRGELIAVTADTVFVADSTLRAIASTGILSARLAIYDASSLAGYVVLGTLSTVSNGFLLAFTAPLWLIGGSIAAASRSYDPIIDFPEEPLTEFVPFARYPQGLSPDLNRQEIKSRQHK